ncbi:MAG: YIP1 family protein [Acidimicrobiia bacterium]
MTPRVTAMPGHSHRGGTLPSTAHQGTTLVGVVFHRLFQTIKLERDAFVWMDFNDRATGDAAILVGITQVLLVIGTGTSLGRLVAHPFDIVSLLISAAIFWLLYAAATYAIVRFLLDGHGSFPLYLRIAGFAYPTLLLLVFSNLLFSYDQFILILVVGAAWFVLIMARGVSYASDFPTSKALVASVGGYIAVLIVQQVAVGLRVF